MAVKVQSRIPMQLHSATLPSLGIVEQYLGSGTIHVYSDFMHMDRESPPFYVYYHRTMVVIFRVLFFSDGLCEVTGHVPWSS